MPKQPARMATEIPEAITIPDTVETRLGTLRLCRRFPRRGHRRASVRELGFPARRASLLDRPPGGVATCSAQGDLGVRSRQPDDLGHRVVDGFANAVPDGKLRNRLRRVLARPARRPSGGRTPAQHARPGRRFLVPLRHRPRRSWPRPRAGRHVGVPATRLPRRPAGGRLRAQVGHVRQHPRRARLPHGRRPTARRRQHQATPARLSPSRSRQPAPNDVRQHLRRGVERHPLDELLVLRRGQRRDPGGAERGDRPGNARPVGVDRDRERQAVRARRSHAADLDRGSSRR